MQHQILHLNPFIELMSSISNWESTSGYGKRMFLPIYLSCMRPGICQVLRLKAKKNNWCFLNYCYEDFSLFAGGLGVFPCVSGICVSCWQERVCLVSCPFKASWFGLMSLSIPLRLAVNIPRPPAVPQQLCRMLYIAVCTLHHTSCQHGFHVHPHYKQRNSFPFSFFVFIFHLNESQFSRLHYFGLCFCLRILLHSLLLLK